MLAFFVCGKSLEKESVMWLMEKKIWEDWRIINIFVRERILRTWDTHIRWILRDVRGGYAPGVEGAD